ncbi:MAG: leucyl aminopeptidase family protein [Gallionellaceae bacterium]|nr:leucyl aminopeptidase family protein [Gallionellaceae bacterium]
MLAQLQTSLLLPKTLNATHLLVLLPKAKALSKDFPYAPLLASVLKRREMKIDEFAKSAVSAVTDNGSLVVWAMIDFEKETFAQQVQVRKALQVLLEEQPKQIGIVALGDEAQRKRAAELAVYGSWVNATLLPVQKKNDERKPLKKIELFGYSGNFDELKAQAEGNILCRELTVLPPNTLTPAAYRGRISKLAKEQGWKHEEFDLKKLRKIGAGAFVAVAQGSADEDAAIVHLSYKHPKAKQTIALVGKGICFDTGGHNLKPARYMNNMHEDMNGSAVALGILLAATQSKLPVNIDCWLALAQNHIGPKAYKQNDVVTALNGTTIEIVHTDAEGRMVLADTLTLASRAKPNLLIDFATLTGSMAVALGARYSGVFATNSELAHRAVRAGKQSGERVCVFPQDEDYEPALDSKIADIKQCTLDGEADHILATRFLKRFVEHDTPWIHVDLSASRCEGGLGAVASDVNGFGVAWGVAMLQSSVVETKVVK